MKNQGNMASQKENNFPATKLKGIGYYHLIIQNSCYEEIQEATRKLKDNPVKSGVKLMNRRSSLPKRLRF